MECKILGGTVQGAAVHIALFLLLCAAFSDGETLGKKINAVDAERESNRVGK